MNDVALKTRPLKRVEYECLVDGGFLRSGDPVELVGGQLIVGEPQDSRHFATVRAVEEALRAAFGAGWEIRGQAPLALDDESEPEPDVVVVPGRFRDYVGRHPSRPALLVEVGDSSLALDQNHKASLYARAAVADYWIVNLLDDVLEVRRDPAADTGAPFGWRYRTVTVLGPGESVSPLVPPGAHVRVAELLLRA